MSRESFKGQHKWKYKNQIWKHLQWSRQDTMMAGCILVIIEVARSRYILKVPSLRLDDELGRGNDVGIKGNSQL